MDANHNTIVRNLCALLFFCLLSSTVSGQRVFGTRIYRSPGDSVKYEAIRQRIIDNLKADIKSDNHALHVKGEKLIVKFIPMYQYGTYAFYDDLQRTNRPDTITKLGLYLLDGKELPEKVRLCTNLRELDISGCHINKLPPWLGELKYLEVLTVAKSGLRRMKIRNLHTSSVKTVNLAYNELRRIPKGLAAFDSLEEINLTGNQLRSLPKLLGRLPHLAYVNLGYNHLRHSRMKANNNVKSINLSHNGMHSMPFSLGKFSQLTSLNLSYNSISTIKKDIGGSALMVVNLYNNRLKQVPETILKLSAIMNLDLSHNEITSVPSGIERMKSLNVLSFWDNDLTNLPNELTRIPGLSTLYLQDNQLSVLSDSLSRLPLVKLDVGYNRLTTIPAWVFKSQAIQELYVNNNDIVEIGEDILSMQNLKILYIFGNPLTDEATIRRYVKVLRERNVDVRQ
ncbi:MAG: hypothetical protein QM762_07385 [Chryseolinea sp.]